MRQIYEGPCRGGPLRDRRLAHYAERYEIMRGPMVELSMNSGPNDKVEVVTLGEYAFVFGQWIWRQA